MENQTERKKVSYKDREILKRAARHCAFISRFAPGFYVTVTQSRKLIRGLIDDYERHPAFNLMHRINNRKPLEVADRCVVFAIKNERSNR